MTLSDFSDWPNIVLSLFTPKTRSDPKFGFESMIYCNRGFWKNQKDDRSGSTMLHKSVVWGCAESIRKRSLWFNPRADIWNPERERESSTENQIILCMLRQYCTASQKRNYKNYHGTCAQGWHAKIKIIITAHAKDDKQIPDGFSFLKTNHE